MESKYIHYRPSSSYRILNCPASLKLANMYSKNISSKILRTGTLGHKIAEEMLKEKYFQIPAKLQALKRNEDYSIELQEVAEKYVDTVSQVYEELDDKKEIFIEEPIKLQTPFFEISGIADAIILTPDEIQIFDLKTGWNKVSAFHNAETEVGFNPQLAIYALGAYEIFKDKYPNVDKMSLHIVQPNCKDSSIYQVPIQDLQFWYDSVLIPNLEEAVNAEKPRHQTGPWCSVCDAEYICQYRLNQIEPDSQMRSDLKQYTELSGEKLGELFSHFKELAKYSTKLRDEVKRRLEDGQEVSYFILKDKNKRVWISRSETEEFLVKFGLDSDLFLELISPLQVENLLKKENLYTKENKEKLENLYRIERDGKQVVEDK